VIGIRQHELVTMKIANLDRESTVMWVFIRLRVVLRNFEHSLAEICFDRQSGFGTGKIALFQQSSIFSVNLCCHWRFLTAFGLLDRADGDLAFVNVEFWQGSVHHSASDVCR
jgi:hypothetical protein